ncbi:MAG TPA: site-specific integrase [Nitrososphaeraceae archaeon]|nr:site-specific integrase [Nitrososphaeraceae archaeon]
MSITTISNNIKELQDNNVLKFLEIIQEKDQSILTITRCISIIIQIRKQIDKPLSTFTKEDIKRIFQWMDNKRYKVETVEKYRAVIKKYYKMVYGNNEYYPDCVKWFSVKVGKDKYNQERGLDIAEYLEEEEIPILIGNTPTLQKKAFLACLYESGSRPEEYLRLSNLDCKIDTNGAILILRGKTGERRIRIVSFAKLLQQWLDVHPLKDQKQFPLWISQATNYNNQPLGLRGAQLIIEEALAKAKLDKHKRLYLLRHSLATHLCKWLTEAQMCVFFGWQQGTKVVRRYIHLSGKDLDSTLLSISEEGRQVNKQAEYLLKTRKCQRCTETLSPSQQFCGRCGLTTILAEQYTTELDLERENRELKQQIQMVKEDMDNKFNKIISMIQQNPLLINVKPEILEKK